MRALDSQSRACAEKVDTDLPYAFTVQDRD